MKITRLLAVLALSCWVASVWPNSMLGGETWILLDRSPSMGAEPSLEDWLSTQDLDMTAWRKAVAKRRVISFPHPKGIPTTDLSEAMRQMRPRLSAGDHLIVRTDGRSLSALPDPDNWRGIRITALPPTPQPQFHQVIAPTTWPSAPAAGIWMRIRMQDADLPNGDLEVFDASGQVEGLNLQNHGDGWLALQLRCEESPQDSIELRLRWREEAGLATHRLRIHPPSQRQVTWVDATTKAEPLRQALQQGAILAMADAGIQAWQNLPPDLAVFQTKEEMSDWPLWVLFDVSGSMEGHAMEEATEALTNLVKHWPHGPIQVVPFQQGLLPTLTLRSAADLAQLQELVAFGPTDLATALEQLGPKIPGEQALLILSDGAAAQPDLPWKDHLHTHLPQTKVFCLPMGPMAEWDFLRGLGEVLDQGSLAARLDQVLQGLQESTEASVFPVRGNSFPLPQQWTPGVPHPAWNGAPGAEILLENSVDLAYLGIRRVGPGLLIGIADRPDSRLEPLLRDLEQAFRAPTRDGWVGSRFFVSTAAQPPIMQQGDRSLEPRMHDVGPPVRWEGLDPSPLEAVKVTMPDGGSWLAGPLTDAEWGISPDPWLQWLEIQRNGLTGSVFRPRLLWAGLILLTAAFVLRTLPTR